MNPIEAISSVLGKFVTFSGRASRSEFWWWWLFNLIVGLVVASTAIASRDNSMLMVYYLATFLPTLAVTVRRHHDGNRSGWFILLGLIPIIGGLILLFLYISKGTNGPNIYGPDPLKY